MVDAVTKISAAQSEGKRNVQKAETYRKFIAAMAKDPRDRPSRSRTGCTTCVRFIT